MSAVRLLGRCLDGRGRPGLCEVQGDRVQPLEGDLFGELRAHGKALDLSNVRLLPPVMPGKVVGVGTNYRAHALEMGKGVPTVPKIFLKPSTAVIGPGEPIVIPPGTVRVDHEAELGVIIGRTMSRVKAADAYQYIAGYTCVNDVTARDFQKEDGVFARAKGFDSFCPLGPVMAVGLDPTDLAVRCRVDGALRQDSRTSDLVFDIPTLLEFISNIMTLLPGDVLSTGTPAGVSPLRAGQVVEVELEGIGVLSNPVIDREDRVASE